jgi:site-specific DNA recombinase
LTLSELFIEKGMSGRRDDRPQLARLLASLDDIDRLVIPKLDRLGRSNRHLQELFETLSNSDVALVSLADSIDTSTATGKLMRNMLACLAEFESDTLSERVKAVTGTRVAAGGHHGRAPYGYVSERGVLKPSEPQASVVRRIFAGFAAGTSQQAICRALNTEGIRSRTGSTWTQGTISKILRNPTYVGKVEVNGEQFDGTHEPLVSQDIWQSVESLRSATARTGRTRGRPSSGSHLFTRSLSLKCAHCDSTMIPRTSGSYEVYRCSGRITHGKDFCPMPPVPRSDVDSAVFAYFESAALDIEASAKALADLIDRQATEVDELRAQAQRDSARAAESVTRVRRDYTNGHLTAAEWRALSGELNAEQQAADAQLEALAKRADQTAAARAAVQGAALERLAEVRFAIAGKIANASDLDAVRAALARMFESFYIGQPDDAAEQPPAVQELMRQQDAEIDAAAALDGSTALDGGKWVIGLTARPEVIAGIGELRKVPLNIDAVGLQT